MGTFCSVELFIPCNKRVQNMWTEWAHYIMLLVIEPQSPESGLVTKLNHPPTECLYRYVKHLLYNIKIWLGQPQRTHVVPIYLIYIKN